jgi:hypothetical protein
MNQDPVDVAIPSRPPGCLGLTSRDPNKEVISTEDFFRVAFCRVQHAGGATAEWGTVDPAVVARLRCRVVCLAEAAACVPGADNGGVECVKASAASPVVHG